MVRSILAIVLAALVAVAFAGPRDNSLIIGTSQEPVLLGDPVSVISTQAIRSEVELYSFSGLYRITLEGSLAPNLVVEVATVDNGLLVLTDGADGDTVGTKTLTLRDDIFWSDGEPITTADIAIVFEMSQAAGMPVASPDYWERVDLQVVDARTFRFSWTPLQASDLLGSPIGLIPAHIYGAPWEQAKTAVAGFNPETDAARITETYSSVFSNLGSAAAINEGRSAYSGPFVPTRWTPGSALQMTRNPFFHDHPENQDAYVQTVEYRFINDTNALLFAVVSGAVDVTSSIAVSFDQAISPQITARAADRYDIWFVPSPVWEHLEINQFTNVQAVADNQLDDLRTRQAITYAIDRQGMSDALFDGLQPVAHSNVSPFDPTYNPDVPEYAYDPEQARVLLSELGWTPGADGILTRTTADGRTARFELEFVTTAGNAVRERQQQFIAEDLRQVGIDVRINNAPSNVVFASDFINRAYDGAWTGMFMFAWLSSQAGALNQTTYSCTARPTPESNYTGQNAGGACSERWEALRTQAVAELDFATALPIYQEMQTVYAEELLAIPLIFRSNPLIVSNGVLNYVAATFVNGFGYPPAQTQFVGWEQNGATKRFDQADYARSF